MTFPELVEIVHNGYHPATDPLTLDNLFTFIVRELYDNYDPEVEDCIQLGTAIDILNSVKEDIDIVLDGLSQEFYKPERD